MSNFMKMRQVEAEFSMQTDRWTYLREEANSRFLQFFKRA